MLRLPGIVALGSLLLAASRAWAVVEAEMPLAQLVRDSQVVALATLEQVDHDNGKGVLKVQRVLRGDAPLPSLPVRLLRVGSGEGSPRDMLDRVEEGNSLLLFVAALSPTDYQVLAYSNGSWFKLSGVSEGARLKATIFLQGEPYLRRTFHGDVTELVELIDGFTAGSGKLPDIDKSASPGLGPTLHDSPASPTVAASESAQVELGPAWLGSESSSSRPPGSTLNYAVAVVLLTAAVGLVFMLTRSSPGTAA